MELDKRIVEGKRPLTCFDTEQAKQFIGKKCYFSDEACDFMDLDKAGSDTFYVAELQNIWTAEAVEDYCFADNSNDWRFILPLEWVKEEKTEPEPKYRPYTIKDFEKAFLNGEFEDFIIFRDKHDHGNVYTMRYNGNYTRGKYEYICLGAKNYSFESLFENYEVADYDGDWQPFGVLVENE